MPPNLFVYPEPSERSFAPYNPGYNSLRGSASARRARPLPWMWLFVVLNLLKRITKAQSFEGPEKIGRQHLILHHPCMVYLPTFGWF